MARLTQTLLWKQFNHAERSVCDRDGGHQHPPGPGTNGVPLPLTADEEFQAGFACNGVKATPTTPLPAVCPASEFTSDLINIPVPGTGDNDHNPQRIAPRSLLTRPLAKKTSSAPTATSLTST